jgi:hypothetical protein
LHVVDRNPLVGLHPGPQQVGDGDRRNAGHYRHQNYQLK